ncbi:MAG: M56 family metallopeptidase [Eubacteriales bacterium]|nr:M56 family metallopeptidase [Eubacteriales bacterium]
MSNIIVSEWCIPVMLILLPILCVGLYFLRKSRFFTRYYGVSTILVLYILCAFRVLVPLEFPRLTLDFDDQVVFAAIYDVLMNRSPLTSRLPVPLLDILIFIWAAGTVIYLIVFTVRYQKLTKKYSRAIAEPPKCFLLLFEEVKRECKVRSKINLVISGVSPGPVSFGIFKKYVVLPADDYDLDELRYILMHECTHIRNRDALIKIITEVFVTIFWWNPFVYLLKKDLSHVLEIKCDQRVLENKTAQEKKYYCEILSNHLEKAFDAKDIKACAMLTLEFASEDDKRLEQRVRYILDKKASKTKSVVMNAIVLLCAAALLFSSYLIQWKPNYHDYDPTHDEEGNVLSNEDNAYVLHKKDGTYEFYFDGFCVPVPEEEIELGYYRIYPIITEE